MAQERQKQALKRTISDELLTEWRRLKRIGDSKEISDRFGWSRPTIDNALNKGHVQQTEIVGQINTFFMERMEKEKRDAQSLLNAQKK